MNNPKSSVVNPSVESASSFQSLLQAMINEQLVSSGTLETRSQVDSEQMIECVFDSCEARCNTIGNLTKHLRKDHTASTKNPSLCKICQKSLSSGQTLIMHYIECARIGEASNQGKENSENLVEVTMETAREIEVNTPVEESIEFGDEDPINDEKDNVEEDKNMFCYHCGIGFTDNTLYQFHKMFHGSPNPFHCANCGMQLDDKYEFNAHLVLFSHGSRSV
ncbi:unnamed protein product [Caenorhabditis brenneri]